MSGKPRIWVAGALVGITASVLTSGLAVGAVVLLPAWWPHPMVAVVGGLLLLAVGLASIAVCFIRLGPWHFGAARHRAMRAGCVVVDVSRSSRSRCVGQSRARTEPQRLGLRLVGGSVPRGREGRRPPCCVRGAWRFRRAADEHSCRWALARCRVHCRGDGSCGDVHVRRNESCGYAGPGMVQWLVRGRPAVPPGGR